MQARTLSEAVWTDNAEGAVGAVGALTGTGLWGPGNMSIHAGPYDDVDSDHDDLGQGGLRSLAADPGIPWTRNQKR